MFLSITEGRIKDLNLLGEIALPEHAAVLLNWGYIDFTILLGLTQRKINFVVHCRSNLRYRVIAEFDVDETTGLRAVQRITLTQPMSLKKYPDKLRRVEFYGDIHGTDLVKIAQSIEPERALNSQI